MSFKEYYLNKTQRNDEGAFNGDGNINNSTAPEWYTTRISKKKKEDKNSNGSSDYISSFLKESSDFISTASNNIGSITYSTAQSDYNSDSQNYNTFRRKADNVRNILNKSEMSDEKKKTILDYLDTFDSDWSQISDAYKKNIAYFSQWENEESYNYAKEKAENKKKVSAMSDEELQENIDRENSLLSNVGKIFPSITKNKDSSMLDVLTQERTMRKYQKIESLPDDIKSLINEYTELDREKEENTVGGFLSALSNVGSGGPVGASGVFDKNALRRIEIEKQLNKSGVDDWKDLVEYNRIVKDEDYYSWKRDMYKETAEEHPVLSSVSSVLASPTKVLGVAKMLGNALDDDVTVLNPNSVYFAPNDYVNDTRNTVMEKYDWKGKYTNIDWFDELYSTAMSTGDSILSGAIGGKKFGGVILGATAASDAAQEVARNGGSKEQALMTGLTAGVNEMLWETVSIGQFKGLSEKNIKNLISKKGVKTLVGNVLKSAGVNFTEEAATECANIIADYNINGGMSSYGQALDSYLAAGYSESEARTKASRDMGYQILHSGFGGALQGILMGGTGSVIGAVSTESQLRSLAKSYSAKEVVALQQAAKSLGIDSKAIDVGEIGSQQSVGKVANLIGLVEDKITQNPEKDLVEKAKSYGIKTGFFNTKTEKGMERLAKKVETVETEILNKTDQMSDSIYMNAIKNRLVELGEKESVAEQTANALIKKYNGSELSESDNAAINTDVAAQVFNEFTANDDSALEWVVKADKATQNGALDIVNQYTRNRAKDVSETITTKNADAGSEFIQNIGPIEIGEDGATVNLDGENVPVENISFNNKKTKAAYEFASQFDTTEKAQAALKLYEYNLEQNTDWYKEAFEKYYNAGLRGVGNFESADSALNVSESFPEYWRKAVFNAGRNQKSYTPGVNRMYFNEAVAKQNATQLEILDAIGKKYNLSFLVFDTLDDELGSLNGIQIGGGNKIAISLDADGSLYLRTAGHEVFHFIEEWNSAEAAKLTDQVINYLKSTDEYDYSERVEKYAEKYGVDMSTEEGLKAIHSEIVADSMFDVFSNEKFVKKLVKENKTLAEKIGECLKKFVAELHRIMRMYDDYSPEMTALNEQTAALEDINKSFEAALKTASENMISQTDVSENIQKNTADSGVKYMIQKGYKREVNEWFKNGKSTKKTFILGTTGDVLQGLGAIESDIYMTGDKIIDILNKHSEMGVGEIKRIPEILEDPVLILKSRNVGRESKGNTRLVIFGNIKAKDGRPILSVLDLRPHERNLIISDMQKVTSSYTKDSNPVEFVQNSEVIYADKKRTTKLLRTIGFQMPIELQSSGYIGSISYKGQNVNISGVDFSNVLKKNMKNSLHLSIEKSSNEENNVKYSLKKEFDSDGNELSEEQIEYFKNTKVRDEEENLLKVYHGTDAEFTLFDNSKGRANMDIQGSFFSPWQIDAAGYGPNVKAYYLNIKNPASESVAYRALNKFKGQNNAGIKAREYLENLGYDGVDNENEEYIAFYPNQIKLADNLNPTVDNDVRYSIKEIVDENNNSYGLGVKLDSVLLDNLSSKERINAVKQFIKKLGGTTLVAYDKNQNTVNINIAERGAKLKNKDGTRVSVNKDLSSKYINNRVKQEAIVLVDELVTTSKYDGSKSPSYPHGWLDDNGNNDWEYWKTYIEDKNNTVWVATLNIANTSNGEKILYDIYPIKKAGQAVKSATSAANSIISQTSEKSIGKSQKNSENEQIQKSLKISKSGMKILSENPELANILENLQNELKLTDKFVPDAELIKKYANQLKRDNKSTLKSAEIEKDLRNIYDISLTLDDSVGGTIGREIIAHRISCLADKILTNSKILDEENARKAEKRDRLNKYLRGRKWYLSPGMRAEIIKAYGSYGKFHKRIFGHGFSFSESETNYLDGDWKELCAEFPELFDPATIDVEQPLALAEAFAQTDFEYGLNDGEQFNAQFEYTIADITEKLCDIPRAVTKIEKVQNASYRKIQKLRFKNAKKIAALKERYSKEIESNRSEIEYLNKKYTAELRADRENYREKLKLGVEYRKKTQIKNRIYTQMTRLSDMLAHGKKNRHIPLELISSVYELCNTLTLNNRHQTVLSENINAVTSSYKALTEGVDAITLTESDKYVQDLVQQLGERLSTKAVADMSLNDLYFANEVITAVTQRMTNINKLHKQGRAGVEETAKQIVDEINDNPKKSKPHREYKMNSLNEITDKAGFEKWRFLKPVYAWRMIGSETLSETMKELRKGEDSWAVDMSEAKEYKTELENKYHKNQWSDKKVEVELSSGTYHFTVQQLMMLHVAFQREQYRQHLFGLETNGQTVGGGFVFEDAYRTFEKDESGNGKKPKPKLYRERDAGVHKLAESDIDVIENILTAEQKAYADEMRDYLAKECAAKGNEITRRLYGMNKFIEEKYFPIVVAKEFLDGTLKESDVHSVLSSSMIKDLQKNAANPILIRDFDKMWSKHVNEMAMFHSFALPVDDFTRIYNYKNGTSSTKTVLETKLGKGAVSYIENFMKDVNGGVMSDGATSLVNKALNKFKKNAVFASASVAIQQPSAIARALAEVDAKYFASTTFSKRDYEECMKYAPIARVKSMGAFDPSVGTTSTQWLESSEPNTAKEKIKAFFSVEDSSYRDSILSVAPEKMDEITWAHIWNAVKKEQAEKTGLKGDELLKAAGERFTEVIELTQVYDSVFSRSELMRSKDTGMKAVTAFMAEPTTSLNMLVDAVSQVKNGKVKKGGRYIGAYVCSVVLNNILKSLVTAPRDEDEEKTIVEKYLANFVDGTISDLNPLTLIPIAKDIVSVFEGYDVGRSDMSLVQDLYDSLSSLGSSNKSALEKTESIVGSLAAFLGLPIKNILRDTRAAFNLACSFTGLTKDDEYGQEITIVKGIGETSAEGITDAIGENRESTFWNKKIKVAIFGSTEKQLYLSVKNGDYEKYKDLLENEFDGDSGKLKTALRKGLIDYDERIAKAAQARRDKNTIEFMRNTQSLLADGFTAEDIGKAINSYYDKLQEENPSTDDSGNEKSYSVYSTEDLNIALETGGDYEAIIDDMITVAKENGKTTKEAESSVRSKINNYWRDIYFEASENERVQICEMLDSTGLYYDVEKTTANWLKNKYKTAYKNTTDSYEREIIKKELWATGCYKSYSKMIRELNNSLDEEDE